MWRNTVSCRNIQYFTYFIQHIWRAIVGFWMTFIRKWTKCPPNLASPSSSVARQMLPVSSQAKHSSHRLPWPLHKCYLVGCCTWTWVCHFATTTKHLSHRTDSVRTIFTTYLFTVGRIAMLNTCVAPSRVQNALQCALTSLHLFWTTTQLPYPMIMHDGSSGCWCLLGLLGQKAG